MKVEIEKLTGASLRTKPRSPLSTASASILPISLLPSRAMYGEQGFVRTAIPLSSSPTNTIITSLAQPQNLHLSISTSLIRHPGELCASMGSSDPSMLMQGVSQLIHDPCNVSDSPAFPSSPVFTSAGTSGAVLAEACASMACAIIVAVSHRFLSATTNCSSFRASVEVLARF